MKNLREIHGLSNLPRAAREGADVNQEVLIRDRNGCVHLELSVPGYGASLTPDAARYLVNELLAAVERIERGAMTAAQDKP